MADNNHHLIENGLVAQHLLVNSQARLAQQETAIVTRLVTAYKGNKLTTEMLWGGLGEICGLRDFRLALQSEARRGQQARQEEVG